MSKKPINMLKPALESALRALGGESDIYDFNSEERKAIHDLLSHVMIGADQQMQTAIELTKIVLEKIPSANKTAEDIFKTYNRAMSTVIQTSPLPYLLAILGAT